MDVYTKINARVNVNVSCFSRKVKVKRHTAKTETEIYTETEGRETKAKSNCRSCIDQQKLKRDTQHTFN